MNSKKIEGFENYTIYENGDIWSDYKSGCKLTPYLSGKGYYSVKLRKDEKNHTKFVHRLVGLAFIPNPENKPCIDHIDRNRTNNNLNNLRWVTPKENQQNRGVFKGCIYINTRKYKDKVYERIQFKWCVNGITIVTRFETIEDAKNYQLFRLCFCSWREISKK